MKRVKKSKQLMDSGVIGKGKAAGLSAVSYQRLLGITAQSDVLEAIRQGIDDVSLGRTRLAREVFRMLRRKWFS